MFDYYYLLFVPKLVVSFCCIHMIVDRLRLRIVLVLKKIKDCCSSAITYHESFIHNSSLFLCASFTDNVSKVSVDYLFHLLYNTGSIGKLYFSVFLTIFVRLAELTGVKVETCFHYNAVKTLTLVHLSENKLIFWRTSLWVILK